MTEHDRKKLLIVTRNYHDGPGRQLGVSFLDQVLSVAAGRINREVVIISLDDVASKGGDHSAKDPKQRVIHVRSSWGPPRGSTLNQYNRDMWLGRIRVGTTRIFLRQTLDALRILRVAIVLIPKVGVIHWIGMYSPIVGPFRLVSRLFGVKNYVTLFDARSYAPLHNYFFRSALFSQDALIVPTLAFKNWLSNDLGISADKIVTVPLATDLSRFSPSPKSAAKTAKGIDPTRLVISWFGPITPSMTLDDFNSLYDSVQRVATHIPEVLFNFCFKYGAPFEAPLNDHIRFSENLSSINEELRISDLVALPFGYRAHWLGLPLTIVEALACGVPVITMDNPGLDEVIVHGVNGFLVKNVQDIPETILQIHKQQTDLEKMSRNARMLAEMHFDIKRVGEEYAKLWS